MKKQKAYLVQGKRKMEIPDGFLLFIKHPDSQITPLISGLTAPEIITVMRVLEWQLINESENLKMSQVETEDTMYVN